MTSSEWVKFPNIRPYTLRLQPNSRALHSGQ